MQKIVFASKELPRQLDDQARFSLWRELFTSLYCPLNLFRPEDRPFSLRFECVQHGPVGIGRIDGTLNRVVHTAQQATANDDFVLVLNRGPTHLIVHQNGREAKLDCGSALLVDNSRSGEIRSEAENRWFPV